MVKLGLYYVSHILKAIIPVDNLSHYKHFLSILRGVRFFLTQWDAYVNSILHCDICDFLPLKFSHYPSRPVPVPELFCKYPTRPVPKSKTPTRRTLLISHCSV